MQSHRSHNGQQVGTTYYLTPREPLRFEFQTSNSAPAGRGDLILVSTVATLARFVRRSPQKEDRNDSPTAKLAVGFHLLIRWVIAAAVIIWKVGFVGAGVVLLALAIRNLNLAIH
jgi:hypothetical protein